MMNRIKKELYGFYLRFALAWRVLTSRSTIVIRLIKDKSVGPNTYVASIDCRCRDKIMGDLYDRLTSFVPHWGAQWSAKQRKEDEAN